MDDFIILCTGHLANIGSNISNVDIFDDTMFLKLHSLIFSPISLEKL